MNGRSLSGPLSDLVLAAILVVLCVFSLSGLLLAFGGVFSPAVVLGVGTAATLLLGFAGWRSCRTPLNAERGEATPLPPFYTKGLLPIMLVVGAGLYLRVGEPIAGNWDPGVYLAQGAALARDGSYLFDDTASPLLEKEEKEAIYPEGRGDRVKYPGFYVSPRHEHRLEPQFYPLFPVVLGIASGFGSTRAPLYAAGTLSLLSLVLVLKIGERIEGWRGATAAGLLFLFNPVQIWFSGFPSAEGLMQFLFLAAVWSWLVWLEEDRRAFSWLAGTCTGLIMFTSVTGLLLVALMIGAYLVSCHRRRGHLTLLLPVVALLPLAALQNVFFTRQYFDGITHYVPALVSMLTRPAILLPVCAGILALIAWRCPLRPAHRDKLIVGARFVVPALCGGGLLLLAWRLFTADPVHDPLRVLASMVSRAQLLVAAAGLFLLAWKRPRVGWTLLVVGGLFTYVFLTSRMMTRMYPWAFKRYLPVTLPLLCVGAGYAWSRACAVLKHPAARAVLLLALIALAAKPLYRGRTFAFHRDWNGLLPFTTRVAEALPEDAVVVAAKWIATPLEFIYGKTVLPLNPSLDGEGFPEAYTQLVARLRSEGHDVYLVAQPHLAYLAPRGSTVVHHDAFETSVLDQSRLSFGATPRAKTIEIEVVRLP